MNRFLTIPAVLVVATLVLFPVQPAAAARKKPAVEKAKAPAVTGNDAGSDGSAPSEKKGTGTPLDLPLPAEGGSGAPARTTNAEGTPPGAKPGADAPTKDGHAANATVEPESIAEFAVQPPRIQQLIRDAIDLTRLNLAYTASSADPDNGGMDGPGAIYYLLHAHRFNDVVREASGQYLWVRKSGAFFPVVNRNDESVEFNELLPGDLLFWRGAAKPEQDVPISEVMIYLGREKETGQRIMFGASAGRGYHGVQRRGVSVYDFAMPKPDAAGAEKDKADFVGFARVPGMRSGGNAAVPIAGAAGNASKPTPNPPAKSVPKKKGKSKK